MAFKKKGKRSGKRRSVKRGYHAAKRGFGGMLRKIGISRNGVYLGKVTMFASIPTACVAVCNNAGGPGNPISVVNILTNSNPGIAAMTPSQKIQQIGFCLKRAYFDTLGEPSISASERATVPGTGKAGMVLGTGAVIAVAGKFVNGALGGSFVKL